jgi:Methyltransferase domain
MEEKASFEQQYGISATLCDFILKHQLEELQPLQIVDFGAGGGKNGRIARKIVGDRCSLIAVEGSEKTAQMLSAEGPYDKVHCALIQQWVFEDAGKYDVAIFGDVLEHLKPGEIHKVIGQCLARFNHIIVVCPLHDIFQDDAYGNELEVHRTYITSGFFDRYNCVEKHIMKGKEWSIMNVRILPARAQAEPVWRKVSWSVFHRTMLVLQPLGLARPLVNVLKRYALKYKWLIRN